MALPVVGTLLERLGQQRGEGGGDLATGLLQVGVGCTSVGVV